MAARISNDGLWRVTYGELGGLTFDELKARQPAKFKSFLPGNPDPEDYKVVNFSPYKVHQRLAQRMRVGRFLLAADAAHCKIPSLLLCPMVSSVLLCLLNESFAVCNPFGGLGLTGGIVDVGGLHDCLSGIFSGKADGSILDKYDEVRRSKYNEIVNPTSSGNIRVLFEQNPDTALNDSEFLRMCKEAETDPEVAAKMKEGLNALQYDFTQHYRI
jgi:2-polyprenyl-6-methoxyphenol hydroxylase-like FAD-dependent oxidoreductase